ncbi:MAG: adenosylhomocysteinase [Candidatus Omnitrophica bacterium]|nr:adenosylhomocysteinase [Candidatus Omnitrophota bacterium]
MNYQIKDIKLAKKGLLRIEWAKNNMPVLTLIMKRFKNKKPLKNLKISCCLHVTTETAVLIETLICGGAKVSLCASNPLSTQDDVAAALVKEFGVSVYAKKGEDTKTYYEHIKAVLFTKPDVTMDDGADLVSFIHNLPSDVHKNIIGGTEETTTGVIRLKALAKANKLRYPIIAVNEAKTKHFFDNRYGTGQSTIDGIIRATNKLIAGTNFVVCGYGWCGKGLAMRAKGAGANVIVVEIDPLKALEACMDGYNVLNIKEASRIGDIFVTVTGNINVIRKEHFKNMKNGAIVANAGHFNVEIDIQGLQSLSKRKRLIRDFVEEYTLYNGKKIYLLAEGRLINLVSAEGHPAQVMDLSFANQALSVEYLKNNYQKLEKKVYIVPQDIDNMIAMLKLKTMGIKLERLTAEQRKYLSSWRLGT